MLNPVPKPVKTTKQLRARAQRAESRHAQQVRAQVFKRDNGNCRLSDPALWLIFGACDGPLEWAHLGAQRRFKTRGLSPAERHGTAGTAFLCAEHHGMYDSHKMQIQPAS